MFANWYSVQIQTVFAALPFFTANVVFAVCTASRKHGHFDRCKHYTSSIEHVTNKVIESWIWHITAFNSFWTSITELFWFCFFLPGTKKQNFVCFWVCLFFPAKLAYTNKIRLPEVTTCQSVNRAKRPRRRALTFDSSQCPLLGLCPGGRQRYGEANAASFAATETLWGLREYALKLRTVCTSRNTRLRNCRL